MKHGPFLFLGLFFALSLSWVGMIATPQFQIGREQPTNVPPANVIYPTPHSGLANQGREVYRANGCAYCHTQVVRQERTRLDVVLTKPGTNQTALVQALIELRNELSAPEAQKLIASAPVVVMTDVAKSSADAAQKALNTAGAEATVKIVPLGPDIERGWGTRLSVAHDYLYETPLMLGRTRLGPDLTNIGLRRADKAWHLIHLYDPRLEVPGSTMPRYPFLFEKHKRGSQSSPNALQVPGDDEVVPSPQANALVAYLLSLRAETLLFEAPGPQLAAPAGAGDTNQPAAIGGISTVPPGAGTTNQAATNQASPQ